MEQVRTRILQAALELFSTNGYAGTRTREIARRAEVAEVTLFRHFGSKEILFQETILHFLPNSDFKNLIEKAGEMEYRKSLTSIAHSFLDGLKDHKAVINIMYMESRQHYDLMEKIYIALLQNLVILLTEYFTEMQERGLVRKLDTSVIATTFLGMIVSLFEYDEILVYARENSNSINDKLDALVDIFFFGTRCIEHTARMENPEKS